MISQILRNTVVSSNNCRFLGFDGLLLILERTNVTLVLIIGFKYVYLYKYHGMIYRSHGTGASLQPTHESYSSGSGVPGTCNIVLNLAVFGLLPTI